DRRPVLLPRRDELRLHRAVRHRRMDAEPPCHAGDRRSRETGAHLLHAGCADPRHCPQPRRACRRRDGNAHLGKLNRALRKDIEPCLRWKSNARTSSTDSFSNRESFSISTRTTVTCGGGSCTCCSTRAASFNRRRATWPSPSKTPCSRRSV